MSECASFPIFKHYDYKGKDVTEFANLDCQTRGFAISNTVKQGWILPVICGSLGVLAQMARQARSSMLEVIRSDFIDTAKAKGLSRRTIIYKYALPNGLIPIVQTLGNAFGTSLGGTLIIETVFSIPGVGMYLQQGIGTRDRPIVRSSVVVLSILFSLIMLLVDLAFAFIDPRIKAQYARGGRVKKKRIKFPMVIGTMMTAKKTKTKRRTIIIKTSHQ